MNAFLAPLCVLWMAAGGEVNVSLPVEPVEIGYEPQFVFDNYIIDNHWAKKYKTEAVTRLFHPTTKYEGNPLLKESGSASKWVLRDPETGLFRMWYHRTIRIKDPSKANDRNHEAADGKGRKFRTYVAYAESTDGIRWTTPDLDLYYSGMIEPNNIVLGDPKHPEQETCAPQILEVPERDRRGYRFIMMYRMKGRVGRELAGIHLIGSNDGIHWDPKSDMRIAQLGSDTHNTVVYDPRAEQYVMFCRPKHAYEVGRSEVKLEDGHCRRMARMVSDTLWTDWMVHAAPQTFLVPDEIDAQTNHNFFYGMPTRYFAGIYWGFLWPFRMNTLIHTELATSRDGIHFDRMPGVPRPKMIEYGPEGSWDDTMIWTTPTWVEMGDEWWIYYSGVDGPHESVDRHAATGLAKIRKEGFVSMHFPAGSGVMVTRPIHWSGNGLLVNVDAATGELKVCLSDERRRPIPGFGYDDCVPFTGDSVAHKVTWKTASLDALNGHVIRIEFQLKNGDLYTFRAQQSSHRIAGVQEDGSP